MPAHALPGSARTRRRSFRTRGRMAWGWQLAPALAACALGVEAAGQRDFDVRPIYYAMLEAVESSFATHSESIEEAYRTTRKTLDERASRDLRHLEAERAEIEDVRRAGDAAFETERTELNAHIKTLNETVARLETDFEGSAAAIESHREAYEHVLAELRTAQSLYRELGAEARVRRQALDAATRAYRDGTGEDAQEIARLENAYRRFAAQVRDALGERETALREEQDSLRTWLQVELEDLERAGRDLAPIAKQYATLEEDHDRTQRELSRRIEVYNERVRAASGDEAQRDEIAALRDEIAEYRESLEEHREEAASLALEFLNRRAALDAEYEAFEEERSERKAALRQRTMELRSEQHDLVAWMESRRSDVQARIEGIEDRARAHLAVLREDVQAAEQRLQEDFGSDPGALLSATTEWTRSLDPALLYDPGGAPRFDPSPLRNSAIYGAVDAVSELASEARSVRSEHLAELRRQGTDIARERQNLIERQSAFAAEHAERQDQWKARLEAANEESSRFREALDAHFEAKLTLSGLEFEALQSVLLDVLGTPATTRHEPVEQDRLLESVSENAAGLDGLLDPANAPADSLVEALATTGKSRDPNAPDIQWEHLNTESFPRDRAPEEQVLDGESKRRLLAAWYGRLSATGTLDPLVQGLSHYFPSHSAAHLENALYGLFEEGMRDTGDVVRFRWMDGRSAYQVRILDRSYWLQPDGSLLLTPLTW